MGGWSGGKGWGDGGGHTGAPWQGVDLHRNMKGKVRGHLKRGMFFSQGFIHMELSGGKSDKQKRTSKRAGGWAI